MQLLSTTFKKYSLLFGICAVSLLPLISLFTTGDPPHTHDGFVHLIRIGAYYKALGEGQIFPRWVGDLNYGYGMPLFNFIYQLPYLIASGFVALGLSLVLSFKITIAISYLLGAIGIYLLAKNLFEDARTILIVSLLYQFAPFRLVELHVRASFGELFTYAFIPFVLYGIIQLYKKPTITYLIVTSISTGLLIISHNSISLVFFGVALLFTTLFARSIKKFFWSFISLALGLIVSSWYWAPALVEHKYTLGDLYMKDLFLSHFPPFINFFIPNITDNPIWQTKGINVQFGLFHTIAIILGMIYIVRKKRNPTITTVILLSSIIILGSLFLMQPASMVVWQKISLLRQFQFPWRLLAPITLACALLGATYPAFSFFKNKIIFALTLILIVASTIYVWVPPLGYNHIENESEYWNYPLNTTYFGETDVIWSAGPAKEYPPAQIQLAAGTATITHLVKQTTTHTFISNSSQSATLVDNTLYFPGWNAYVDGKKTPIQFQDQNWRGIITFVVPPGKHSIVVQFEDTKIRTLTRILSGGTLLVLLFLGLFTLKNKHD